MKAIETRYQGYRFRSRLEARWASFYDALGIKWEYEKEGFDLGNGVYYLPDFYIPHLDCWIEIKGREEYRSEKVELLAIKSLRPVYVFCGQIPNPEIVSSFGPSYNETESAYAYIPFRLKRNEVQCGWDLHYAWCECPDCGFLGIEFDARSDRLPCKESYKAWFKRTESGKKKRKSLKCPRNSHNGDKGYFGNTDKLINAYRMARQARFEFLKGGINV